MAGGYSTTRATLRTSFKVKGQGHKLTSSVRLNSASSSFGKPKCFTCVQPHFLLHCRPNIHTVQITVGLCCIKLRLAIGVCRTMHQDRSLSTGMTTYCIGSNETDIRPHRTTTDHIGSGLSTWTSKWLQSPHRLEVHSHLKNVRVLITQTSCDLTDPRGGQFRV